MLNYQSLSAELTKQILADRKNGTLPMTGFDETNTIRRNNQRDKANVIRTAFVRDIDKIMHCPYYNRYADKTQVFSIRMMISLAEVCMSSWFHVLQEQSVRRLI